MPRNSPSDASPTYLHGAATADMNTFQSEAVTAALEMKEGGLYSFEIRIRCLVSLGLRAGIVGASDSTNLCSVYMDLSTGGLRGRGFEEEVINRRVTLASDTERAAAAAAEVAAGEAQPEADQTRP